MKLIDTDKLMNDIKVASGIVFRKGGIYDVTIVGNRTIISKLSQPRKKGKWNRNGDIPKTCSVCGEDWDKYVEGQEIWYTGEIPNFCPNCGSYNEGEEDE